MIGLSLLFDDLIMALVKNVVAETHNQLYGIEIWESMTLSERQQNATMNLASGNEYSRYRV